MHTPAGYAPRPGRQFTSCRNIVRATDGQWWARVTGPCEVGRLVLQLPPSGAVRTLRITEIVGPDGDATMCKCDELTEYR